MIDDLITSNSINHGGTSDTILKFMINLSLQNQFIR